MNAPSNLRRLTEDDKIRVKIIRTEDGIQYEIYGERLKHWKGNFYEILYLINHK